MAKREVYLITKVVPGEFFKPIAAVNFKLARKFVKDQDNIREFNLTYKTSLNHIRRDGHVALYDKQVSQADVEAQVKGYWSIETIDLFSNLKDLIDVRDDQSI